MLGQTTVDNTAYPIMTMYQGSQFAIQWQKSVRRSGGVFYSVTMNPPGTHIMATTDSVYMIFLVDGTLVNARQLSRSTTFNSGYYRTMLFNSQSPPQAYVMSGYSYNSVTGYKIIKFPSDSVPSSPTWAKQSYWSTYIVSYSLIFGEDENHLFAFASQNGKCVVHKLQESDGVSLWTRGFACTQDAALMKFQDLGSSTYVLMVVGGSHTIEGMRFARLLMSGTTITSSDFVYETALFATDLRARGMKIVDADNIKLILFRSANAITYISSLDYSNLSLTMRQITRYYSDIRSGLFIDASKFLFTTSTKDVYMDPANSKVGQVPSLYYQGQIISSADADTCALPYSTAIITRALAKLVGGFTDLSSSSWFKSTDPTITMTVDSVTSASVIDLDQSKMTSQGDWCVEHTAVWTKPATVAYTYSTGIAKTITLTGLTVTDACITGPLTITYQLLTSTLEPLVSYMTFDPNTLVLSVSSSSVTFTHSLILICTIQNGEYSYLSITVTGSNSPPTFATAWLSTSYARTVPLNSVATVTIQSATFDAEGNPVTMTTYYSSFTTLPTFMTFDSTTYTYSIAPTQYAEVAVFTIYVKLSDGYGQNLYTFQVTVTNSAPYFASALVGQTVTVNSPSTYALPNAIDDEGNAITCSVKWQSTTLPSYIIFNSATMTFTFNPTLATQGGTFSMTVTLSDGQPKTSTQTFSLTVINTAPSFTNGHLQNQVVKLNDNLNYQFTYQDPESNPVTITTSALPGFVTLSVDTFTIHPTLYSQLGTYSVTITLSDSQLTKSSFILVTVTNSAPTFANDPVDQEILLFLSLSYQLPSSSDLEGNAITITAIENGKTTLPSFITLSGDTFTIAPTLASQVGQFQIDVTLSDSNQATTKSFYVTVKGNSPPVFSSFPLVNQEAQLNNIKIYSLPSFSDPEGQTVTLTYSPTSYSFINFDSMSNAFTFSPTQFSEKGKISITVTLSDGKLTNNYPFDLQVTNYAPAFVSSPVNQALKLNDVIDYFLPSYYDDEMHPITVSISPSLSFVTLSGDVLHIAPTLFTEVGIHTLNIVLTDTEPLSSQYPITITVTNTAPTFDSTLPADQTVALNSVFDYVLPSYSDLEGNAITVELVSPLSSNVSVLSGGIIRLQPTLFTQVKTTEVKFNLKDGQPLSTLYSFKVTVTNTAPYFISTVPQNQLLKFSNDFTYQLPPYTDDEGNTVTVSYSPILSFVTLVGDTFTFSPQNQLAVGSHDITVKLSDGQPLSNSYTFTVTVTNGPPIFTGEVPTAQTVKLNQDFYYKLPEYLDLENQAVTVQILPVTLSFATLVSSDTIRIHPVSFKDIGKHDVQLVLTDSAQLSSTYNFTITVTNSPPKFVGMKPQDQTIPLNDVREYSLPAFTDEEGNDIIVVNQLPSFVSFKETTYTISPTTPQHIGKFKVIGSLKDEVSSTSFSFNIIVTNQPAFLITNPEDQTVKFNEVSTYQIPKAQDKESLPVIVQATLLGLKPLPSFIKYTSGVFTFSPTLISDTGEFKLQLSLSDSIAPPTYYSFSLSVVGGPLSQASETELQQLQSKAQLQNIINEKKKSVPLFKIYKAQMKIIGATRDGVIKVKISANKDTSQIIKKIKETDLQVSLVTQQNERVQFTIKSIDSQLGLIKLQLNFANPGNISQTSELDIVRLETINEVYEILTKYMITLEPGLYSDINIPPLVSATAAAVAARFKEGSDIVSVAALPGGFLINIAFSMCIQYIWGLLNDLSFLTMMTMISISLPGIAQIIESTMLNFIYLDVLMTEKWLLPLFFSNQEGSIINESENDEDNNNDPDTPLNQQFDENGFSSTILIKNLGSTFLYLLLMLLGFLILILAGPLSRKFYQAKRFKDWLQNKLVWNAAIRFMIQQFSPLFIASFINLYRLDFNSVGTKFSSYIAIGLVTSLPIGIMLMTRLVYNARSIEMSSNEKYTKRFRTLFEGINTSSSVGCYWQIIVLFRWTFTTIIMVTLRNYPSFQMHLMLLTSVTFQGLILGGKPMSDPAENRMSALNELMVSIYLYQMICLTDFNSTNPFREQFGWALVGTVFFSTTLNVIKFLYILIRAIILKIIRIRIQRQIARTKIYQAQDLVTQESKAVTRNETFNLQLYYNQLDAQQSNHNFKFQQSTFKNNANQFINTQENTFNTTTDDFLIKTREYQRYLKENGGKIPMHLVDQERKELIMRIEGINLNNMQLRERAILEIGMTNTGSTSNGKLSKY